MSWIDRSVDTPGTWLLLGHGPMLAAIDGLGLCISIAAPEVSELLGLRAIAHQLLATPLAT